jgi:hypothetical protein
LSPPHALVRAMPPRSIWDGKSFFTSAGKPFGTVGRRAHAQQEGERRTENGWGRRSEEYKGEEIKGCCGGEVLYRPAITQAAAGPLEATRMEGQSRDNPQSGGLSLIGPRDDSNGEI